MIYKIRQTSRFKKQMRDMLKRGKDENKIKFVIDLLAINQPLPSKYRDHKLSGNWVGCRECHIEPNWLLIYRFSKENGLELVETGTHSELL